MTTAFDAAVLGLNGKKNTDKELSGQWRGSCVRMGRARQGWLTRILNSDNLYGTEVAYDIVTRMAKNTSTSKAKTKTAKKSNAHATTVKRVAESQKASISHVAITKKLETKPGFIRPKRRMGLRLTPTAALFQRLHATSALVFLGLAAAVIYVVKPWIFSINVGFLTKDALRSNSTTVFVPGQHTVYDLDVRWAVVAMLLVSALFAVLRTTKLQSYEDRGLRSRVQPLRWVDGAITGALMVMVSALLLGMQELPGLKLVGSLAAFSLVMAWIAERENAGNEGFIKGTFIASIVSGFLSLSTLVCYAIMTSVYGMVRASWHVYAVMGIVLVAALLVAVVQYRSLRRIKASANYMTVERNYLLINLVSKVSFAAVLIIGLRG